MRKLFPVVLALCVPALLSAQRTLLRLTPPQGQVSQYRIVTRTAVDVMQGSMDASAVLRMTATVTSASGEERTIQTVVDSFRIEAPGMPMPAMPDLVGSTTTVRMTTRGRVLETTYSDSTLTQAFGGMSGPPGQSFPAGMTLPEEPVAPGHQWSDSATVNTDGGQMGAVQVVTRAHYTFQRIERRNGARIAVIGVTGTVTQTSAVMSSEGTLNGSMEFDLDAGRWVVNRMTMEMQINAAGQDATMSLESEGRLVS